MVENRKLDVDEEIELIGLTKQLIKIPSSVKDGNKIYKFVNDYLKEKGFDVKFQSINNPYINYHDYSNLYVRLGNGKGPKIMLNGHLDTVNAERPERWRHPPFSAVEEEGKIYGRGAADMKGGVAAAIMSFIAIAKRKKEINGELFLSCVFGEESPFSLGADTLLREFDLNDYDIVIVTEPSPILSMNDYCFTHKKIHKTNFPVTIVGAEGRVILEVELHGNAAHASHPSRGINALHDASTLVSELARFDIFTNIRRGRGHYVVLNIEGGDPTFTVPEYCKILINRQVMLGENAKSVIREIKKIVRALRLKSKVNVYTRYSPDPLLEYKPYLNESSKYIDLFVEKLCENSGVESNTGDKEEHTECRTCKFTTMSIGDFNLFGTRTKAPVIVFGPGGGNIHAPNEFVNKDEIVKTTNYLLNFLMEVF
ncbi:MAG: M20/M25/M40 family metallo-hydrolase [Candidatus Thermoplasmatota archaeon]|nr:M20/M25/M40 family metallo-hydrolase [Candidatus Thermoplasmatota archaeon]